MLKYKVNVFEALYMSCVINIKESLFLRARHSF